MALTKKQLTDLIRKKDDYVDKNLLRFDKDAQRLQRILFELLFDDFITELQVEDQLIKNSAKNYSLANKLENLFDDFSKNYQEPLLTNYGKQVLGVTSFTKQFYTKQGFSKELIDNLADKMKFLDERIGIRKGAIIKGSFLDSLSKSPEVRTQIKDFVLNGIANQTPLQQFQKQFKTYVVGNSRVDGRLQKYYKQYTHDTFFQAERSAKSFMAEELGLKFFIYTASVIKTTRDFCRIRASKLFSVKEAQGWRKKKWQGKSVPYNPLIDMGGYNCRHDPAYISEETAKQRFPDRFDENGKYIPSGL